MTINEKAHLYYTYKILISCEMLCHLRLFRPDGLVRVQEGAAQKSRLLKYG